MALLPHYKESQMKQTAWSLCALIMLSLGMSMPLSAQVEIEEEMPPAQAEAARIDAAIRERIETWRKEIQESIAKAKKEGGAMPAISMTPPIGEFVPQFEAAAKKFAGTPDQLQFLAGAVNLSAYAEDKSAGERCLKEVLTHHLNNPELPDFINALSRARSWMSDEKVDAALNKILEESKIASAQGAALFALNQETLERGDVTTDEFKQALAKVKTFATEHELKDLLARVDNIEKSRVSLVVGGTATDIKGIDLDGEAFALSDYKGKVILLDFWGDW